MRNGVVDTFEMYGLTVNLYEIVKLRKKYDSKVTLISVNNRISIEFDKHFTTCYICVNGNRAIKYIYGNIRTAIRGITSGLTLGILKSNILFVTNDKTIANHAFIKETTALLKDSLGEIESDLQKASKAKWGLE